MLRSMSRMRWSSTNGGGGLTKIRSAVTAADKLSTPSAPTLSAITEAGSTLANVNYKVSVSAGNRWGSTPGSATANNTPTANQAIRATFGQTTGAEWYDLFLSTAANPLWVGRITEAQRAAGGYIISSVGTVTVGGGAPAGAVDLGIVGTGLANNVNPFAVNTAATPVISGVTPFPVVDYEYLELFVQATVTDLRSLPTLVLSGYQQNPSSNSGADWSQFWTQTVNLLTAVQQPLQQSFRIAVGGAANVMFLVDSISGNGTSVDMWVDLD